MAEEIEVGDVLIEITVLVRGIHYAAELPGNGQPGVPAHIDDISVCVLDRNGMEREITDCLSLSELEYCEEQALDSLDG